MYRYFIKFEDYDNFIDENTKLILKKKIKKNQYKFEDIYYYNNIENDIREYNKKNIKSKIVIEIDKSDIGNYNSLLINKYELFGNDLYQKRLFNENNVVKLINFNVLVNMNSNELNKGNIIILEPCINDSEYLYLNFKKELLYNKNLNKFRKNLCSKIIGSDIYFFTEDKELLDKYSEYLTEIKEVECNKYKIIKNKLYIINAIKNSDLIGLNSSNYYYLDVLNSNSIPIYIIDDEIISLKDNYQGKKAYIIINNRIENILKSDNVLPLLKFINIYELDNGKYKKISLDIKDNKNILKYKRINKRK